jgi:hypothetical protein
VRELQNCFGLALFYDRKEVYTCDPNWSVSLLLRMPFWQETLRHGQYAWKQVAWFSILHKNFAVMIRNKPKQITINIEQKTLHEV